MILLLIRFSIYLYFFQRYRFLQVIWEKYLIDSSTISLVDGFAMEFVELNLGVNLELTCDGKFMMWRSDVLVHYGRVNYWTKHTWRNYEALQAKLSGYVISGQLELGEW